MEVAYPEVDFDGKLDENEKKNFFAIYFHFPSVCL
jgi:hypothetical protein